MHQTIKQIENKTGIRCVFLWEGEVNMEVTTEKLITTCFLVWHLALTHKFRSIITQNTKKLAPKLLLRKLLNVLQKCDCRAFQTEGSLDFKRSSKWFEKDTLFQAFDLSLSLVKYVSQVIGAIQHEKKGQILKTLFKISSPLWQWQLYSRLIFIVTFFYADHPRYT